MIIHGIIAFNPLYCANPLITFPNPHTPLNTISAKLYHEIFCSVVFYYNNVLTQEFNKDYIARTASDLHKVDKENKEYFSKNHLVDKYNV